MPDERTLEILVDFTNAIEAACVNVRQRIAELTGITGTAAMPIGADSNKLPWETKQGTKGAYQQTSKKATSNSDVFQALQRNLKEHGGFWQYRGFKYWFHQQDRDVIDRRKIRA